MSNDDDKKKVLSTLVGKFFFVPNEQITELPLNEVHKNVLT